MTPPILTKEDVDDWIESNLNAPYTIYYPEKLIPVIPDSRNAWVEQRMRVECRGCWWKDPRHNLIFTACRLRGKTLFYRDECFRMGYEKKHGSLEK